jgi:hypothetical protein
LITHASDGFDWDRLIIYLRRVEFVTLVATRLDSDGIGVDTTGALGADLHQNQVKSKRAWAACCPRFETAGHQADDCPI